MSSRRHRKKESEIPHIVPAYRIVDQSKGGDFVKDYVNENLLMIQDDISRAVDQKLNHSVTEVATNFDVPGMSNKRAQMYIYYYILKALKQAEYFPRIEIKGKKSENQKVFIYVKWLSKEDIELEQYMNKFIQAHSIGLPQETTGRIDMSKDKPKPISRRRRKVRGV